MFTGIVEEMGSVELCSPSGEGFDLIISCETTLQNTQLGDSISVNGVCLTVTNIVAPRFTVGLAPETLQRTNLATLKAGSVVNLERSVTPSTRMGGHFVQGHVDSTGTIKGFRSDKDALWVTVEVPQVLMRYIVTKGYITIDGTSLTVVEVGDDWFTVTLVAYTQQHIVMPTKAVGDLVNIEVDVLGKYVENLLKYQSNPAPSTSTNSSNENTHA